MIGIQALRNISKNEKKDIADTFQNLSFEKSIKIYEKALEHFYKGHKDEIADTMKKDKENN